MDNQNRQWYCAPLSSTSSALEYMLNSLLTWKCYDWECIKWIIIDDSMSTEPLTRPSVCRLSFCISFEITYWIETIFSHSLALFMHLKYSLRILLLRLSVCLFIFHVSKYAHIKINQSTQISQQSVGWTQNNIVGVENDAVFKSVPYFSFLFTFLLSISPLVSMNDNRLKHHNIQHFAAHIEDSQGMRALEMQLNKNNKQLTRHME